MRLSQAISQFLTYQATQKSASSQTIKNYRHYLGYFLNYANDIPLAKLTAALLKRYQHQLSLMTDPKTNQPLKDSTQNYYLIALRSLLKYLAAQQLTTLDYNLIKLKAQPTTLPSTIDLDSLNRLLAAPDLSQISGLRDRSIIELLADSGLLVSELSGLDRSQINLDNHQLSLVGKGGKSRTVKINSQVSFYLQQYLIARLDDFEPLFIRFQGRSDSSNDGAKMRLTDRSIERIIQKYAKQVGLSIRVTPHTFRHLKASSMINSGSALNQVQQTLGHQSTATLRPYLKSPNLEH